MLRKHLTPVETLTTIQMAPGATTKVRASGFVVAFKILFRWRKSKKGVL